MSGAIINIVCGVPITDEFHEVFKKYLDGEEPEQEDYAEYGFTSLYDAHGVGRPIGYLGHKILEIKEGNDASAIELMQKIEALTDAVKTREKVEKKIADLPEPLRKAVGNATVWMVWSNS